MKYISMFLLALSLVACMPPSSPEGIEQQRVDHETEIKNKMGSLYEQLHICDNNGGTKDISNGKYGVTVKCKNGVSKTFDN